MRFSTKLLLTVATAARLFVAPSANAAEHAPLFGYMATIVAYDADGDAEIDVVDSGMTQQECAAWLLTAPTVQRYQDGSLIAAECMLDVGD